MIGVHKKIEMQMDRRVVNVARLETLRYYFLSLFFISNLLVDLLVELRISIKSKLKHR